MKNNHIFKEFIRYSSLNVMGMIGLSCYILADTFFVSKGLGTNGLAALNLAIPVYSLINGSGLMIGMGAGTKYSIQKGHDDMKAGDRTFTNAVFMALIFASAFVLAGIFLSGKIAALLGADGSTSDMTVTYLRVLLLFAPAFLMNNVSLCFVRNDGAPQLSMAAMLGGSFSNIILDYVFIFPCGMGMFGAVFATGLAPVISILILSPYFIRKRNKFHFIKTKPSAGIAAGIFSSGVPSLITELSSGIVIIVFNAIILSLDGNTGVAAYGIIANVSLVVIAIYTGIAQGIQPLISTYYGRGNMKNAKTVMKYAITEVIIISAVVYVAVFPGAGVITDIFNSEHNKMLEEIAIEGIKIYFTGCLFAGLNIIISIFFTSVNKTRPAQIISLLRGFILIIPLAYILSQLAKITGVWCAFPCTEVLCAVVAVVLYLKIKNLSFSTVEN